MACDTIGLDPLLRILLFPAVSGKKSLPDFFRVLPLVRQADRLVGLFVCDMDTAAVHIQNNMVTV